VGQRVTRALLPPGDPVRARPTHARFGDGDLKAYEYVRSPEDRERGGMRLVFRSAPTGAALAVEPAAALLIPEDAPPVSAMMGHDLLAGTSFLESLALTIDYTQGVPVVYIVGGLPARASEAE
jgi:hypothetical protein